jgi:hypothetical protein
VLLYFTLPIFFYVGDIMIINYGGLILIVPDHLSEEEIDNRIAELLEEHESTD